MSGVIRLPLWSSVNVGIFLSMTSLMVRLRYFIVVVIPFYTADEMTRLGEISYFELLRPITSRRNF